MTDSESAVNVAEAASVKRMRDGGRDGVSSQRKRKRGASFTPAVCWPLRMRDLPAAPLTVASFVAGRAEEVPRAGAHPER